jgi:hypothetical protein
MVPRSVAMFLSHYIISLLSFLDQPWVCPHLHICPPNLECPVARLLASMIPCRWLNWNWKEETRSLLASWICEFCNEFVCDLLNGCLCFDRQCCCCSVEFICWLFEAMNSATIWHVSLKVDGEHKARTVSFFQLHENMWRTPKCVNLESSLYKLCHSLLNNMDCMDYQLWHSHLELSNIMARQCQKGTGSSGWRAFWQTQSLLCDKES